MAAARGVGSGQGGAERAASDAALRPGIVTFLRPRSDKFQQFFFEDVEVPRSSTELWTVVFANCAEDRGFLPMWRFRSCSIDVPAGAVHRRLWTSLCSCRDVVLRAVLRQGGDMPVVATTGAWGAAGASVVVDVPVIMQRRCSREQWKCHRFSSSPELVDIFVRNRDGYVFSV